MHCTPTLSLFFSTLIFAVPSVDDSFAHLRADIGDSCTLNSCPDHCERVLREFLPCLSMHQDAIFQADAVGLASFYTPNAILSIGPLNSPFYHGPDQIQTFAEGLFSSMRLQPDFSMLKFAVESVDIVTVYGVMPIHFTPKNGALCHTNRYEVLNTFIRNPVFDGSPSDHAWLAITDLATPLSA